MFRPKAFLIDLDGVIYLQDKVIPGAIETIHFLQNRDIPFRFVTNTTVVSRRQLIRRLEGLGLQVDIEHLFTAPVAALQYLKNLDHPRCFFCTSPAVMDEFSEIPSAETDPTHVVIGDAGERFSYEMMNRMFRMIMNGSEIVAFQKNRYWLTGGGLALDAGAFIAALEFASGKEAMLFGKPSAAFFKQACAGLGLPPADVAMIGDDLTVDIRGAAALGLQTVFVRTGKDRDVSPEKRERKPDIVLRSIAELPKFLQG
jgi:HAD superfamily hydrolase (TIGR01458 family)